MTSTPSSAVVPPELQGASEVAHFSPGRWAGNLLIISGQTGVDAAGNVPTDQASEARIAFERLRTVVEFSGLSMGDVIGITSYHVGDASDIHEWFAPVKDDFLGRPWPAWTAVGVQSLADAKARLEISGFAFSSKP